MACAKALWQREQSEFVERTAELAKESLVRDESGGEGRAQDHTGLTEASESGQKVELRF